MGREKKKVQGKKKATLKRPTSSTSTEIETQSHSNVTQTPINKSESGVKREPTMSDQIVSDTEAIVDKKEDIDSKIIDKKERLKSETKAREGQIPNNTELAIDKNGDTESELSAIKMGLVKEPAIKVGQPIDSIKPTTADKKEKNSDTKTKINDQKDNTESARDSISGLDQVNPPHSDVPVRIETYETDSNPSTGNQTKSDADSETDNQADSLHVVTPVDTEEYDTETNPATANQTYSDDNFRKSVQIDPAHGATPVGTEEYETDTNPATANETKSDSNSGIAFQEEPPHCSYHDGTEEYETDTNPATANETKSDSNSGTAVQKDQLHDASPVGTEEYEIITNSATAYKPKSDSNSGTAVQEDPPYNGTPVGTEEYETDTNPATAKETKTDSNSGIAFQEEPPHGANHDGTEEYETDTNPATANYTESDSNSGTAVQEDPPYNATPVGTEEYETITNPATPNKPKSDSNSETVDQEDPPHSATPVHTEEYETDTNPATANETKTDFNSGTAVQEDPPHGATSVGKEEYESDTNPATANETKRDSNSGTAFQEEPPHGANHVGTEEYETGTNPATANKTKSDSNSGTAVQKDPLHGATPVDTEEYEIITNPATANKPKSDSNSETVDQNDSPHSATPVHTEEYDIDLISATANQTKNDETRTAVEKDLPHSASAIDTEEYEFDSNPATSNQTKSDSNSGIADQEKSLSNDPLVDTAKSEIDCKSATADKTEIGSNSATSNQERLLSNDTPDYKKESEIDSKPTTADQEDLLHKATAVNTEELGMDSKSATVDEKDAVESTKSVYTKSATNDQRVAINTDKAKIYQTDSLKNKISNIDTERKKLQPRRKSVQNKGNVIKDNSELAIKLINQKEPENITRSTDIETKTIESQQYVKDIQKNLQHTSTPEAENSELENLQEVIKTTPSLIFAADTNKLLQKLEIGEGISLLGVIVPLSPNLFTAIENLIGQGKHNDTQVPPSSSTSKENELQCHSNVPAAPSNKNENGVKREPKITADQTVDHAELAVVSKNEEKELLENILVNKNESAGLTDLAEVDENKVSANRIESSEPDVNTEPVQDNKKIPDIFDSETNSQKLQQELALRVDDIVLADTSMLSLLWPNLPTAANKTIIGLLKNNDAQVSPVNSTSEFETQKVNNDIMEAYITENESRLENVGQNLHGTELTTIEKIKESRVQTKSKTVDQNEDSESIIFNENEDLQRDTATTDAKTDGNTNLAAVNKIVEFSCQRRTVTVNRNEETLGKKESLQNEKEASVDHTELAMKEPETKVGKPVDSTDLTPVDNKEIIETNSLRPFMVNSCSLTAVKELDLNDLQAWCTTTSSNTGTCLKDRKERELTNVIPDQVNIKTQNQDSRPISQASSYESFDDTICKTLQFHSVHGKNIVLSCSNLMAQRVKSANFLSKGIAFSCRPVRANEMICLCIENLSDYKFGVITFGFTSIDPQTLIKKLPDSCITDLANLPGFWAHRLEKSLCKKNNILNYKMNNSGNVQYGINNIKKGVLYWGIDTSKPIWGYIDIIGYSTALKFTSLKDDRKPSIIAPLPILKYQIHFLPLIPSNLYILKGDNIELLSFKGVVAKTDKNNNKGYIFSKHPIRPGQTIVVQILSAGPKSEFLPLGLTARDPSTLTLNDLPDDAENLTDNSEHWIVYKNVSNCVKNGDELAITLTRKGEVQLTRNDDEPVTVKHVKKSEKFWAILQIYGTVETVRIWSTVRVPPRAQNSEKLSLSKQQQPLA